MIHEIVQIQEIDNHHIDSLVLDHLQFYVINMLTLVLVMAVVPESLNLAELHHV